jgi:tRNA(Arg) A34 adenosine deaminase TadA
MAARLCCGAHISSEIIELFLITEGEDLTFRGEFFNIFNHPQFAIPASTIGSAGVGTITSMSHPSRQISLL